MRVTCWCACEMCGQLGGGGRAITGIGRRRRRKEERVISTSSRCDNVLWVWHLPHTTALHLLSFSHPLLSSLASGYVSPDVSSGIAADSEIRRGSFQVARRPWGKCMFSFPSLEVVLPMFWRQILRVIYFMYVLSLTLLSIRSIYEFKCFF